jgi:hypothetical protein
MRYAKILALIPVLMLGAASALAQAALDVDVSVNVAPPPIPVYDQPPLPEPGYLWTPGYWAWDGMDYYWVPGTWVLPPVNGMLWTPGYWGWRDGFYAWNAGYWGPEVGFYGGIDYGYGYGGSGYQGGYWHGGAFFYNRSVANFGRVNIVNVYTAPTPHWGSSHVSFNGGRGGVRAQPNEHDRAAMGEHHTGLTTEQRDHWQHAQGVPELHASHNGGRPQMLTTQRPGDFAHAGPGIRNHETPRATGGGGEFRGGQGAQIEHQVPQPSHGAPAVRPAPARPEDGPGQHFQPHEQVQPHEQAQPHQQVQPHEHPQMRPPQPPHEQAQPPHEPAVRPQPPQGGHEQGGHEQGPRPQAQHEAAHDKDRHDPGEHRDH